MKKAVQHQQQSVPSFASSEIVASCFSSMALAAVPSCQDLKRSLRSLEKGYESGKGFTFTGDVPENKTPSQLINRWA